MGMMSIVVEKPVESQTTEVLQEAYPGMFPDCVVTR